MKRLAKLWGRKILFRIPPLMSVTPSFGFSRISFSGCAAILLLTTACVFLLSCRKSDDNEVREPQAETAPADGSVKVQMLEVNDVKIGGKDGVELWFKLMCNKDTNVTVRADQLWVETRKGKPVRSWKFKQGPGRSLEVSTSARVQMTSLEFSNKYGERNALMGWVDTNAELGFDVKADQHDNWGQDVLFEDVTKSQAASFHFGDFAAVEISNK